MEGPVEPHLPNSVPQQVNLRHQQVWSTVEQVDREEECSTRNPIAAIVRHAREYALENGYACSRDRRPVGKAPTPRREPKEDAAAVRLAMARAAPLVQPPLLASHSRRTTRSG